jgi:hypothetical protein
MRVHEGKILDGINMINKIREGVGSGVLDRINKIYRIETN